MTPRYQLSRNAAVEIDQILDYLAEQGDDAAVRVGVVHGARDVRRLLTF